ncbi:MAG: glycosyltransferase [Gammaproteobacteria bacterium]|nr:glycosyltransferase [Gammaproteobacteria bacterium]
MTSPLRIVHIIVGLNTGGAEQSLLRLLQHTHQSIKHTVICIGPPSPIGRRIETLGVIVHWLPRRTWFLQLGKIRKILGGQPVDILQGWMYYGNLLASLLARSFSVLPGRHLPTLNLKVAWNIRHSAAQYTAEKYRIRLALQMGRLHWLRPDLIIYNSHAGRKSHERFGYNMSPHEGYCVVIANGIDTDLFRIDESKRQTTRVKLAVAPQQKLVILAGRLHPHKGVEYYLGAICELRKRLPHDVISNLRFKLVGPGMQASEPTLVRIFEQVKLPIDAVQLLGPRADMADLLPAVDVLVLASLVEATPNIVLEAMACGVNVVATKVGDVAEIVVDDACLCEPGDEVGLANCIEYAINQVDQNMQQRRDVVITRYGIEQCAQTYVQYYQTLVG